MRYGPQKTIDVLFVFSVLGIIGIAFTLGMNFLENEEQKRFEDLTCDEILKDLIPGLKFNTDDSTFNQERIWNCMKDKEDPGPQLGGPIITKAPPT